MAVHAPPQANASARWAALGTTVWVLVTEPDTLWRVRSLVERQLDALDVACSRFRSDSELTRLNRTPGRWVTVGPLLFEALETALRAARLTGGDVDPTIGAALRGAGYDRDFAEVPRDRDRSLAGKAAPGWKSVELDRARSAVRTAPGVELDLGATAKALAADRAAHAAALLGGGVLVSLGGDVAVAGEAPSGGWAVRVTDDHAGGFDAPGQTVSLSSGGLATSSVTVRRWRMGGELAHHIIDPASGRPAPVVWRTVSVAAGSCVDANIASTAAIVRGHRAATWIESRGLPARLVAADGKVRRLGGWPAE